MPFQRSMWGSVLLYKRGDAETLNICGFEYCSGNLEKAVACLWNVSGFPLVSLSKNISNMIIKKWSFNFWNSMAGVIAFEK